jgi:hypothetical protein
MINLFSIAYKELEHYKYFWENYKIKNFLLTELQDNNNWLQEFLLWDLTGNFAWYKTYQAILFYLK